MYLFFLWTVSGFWLVEPVKHLKSPVWSEGTNNKRLCWTRNTVHFPKADSVHNNCRRAINSSLAEHCSKKHPIEKLDIEQTLKNVVPLTHQSVGKKNTSSQKRSWNIPVTRNHMGSSNCLEECCVSVLGNIESERPDGIRVYLLLPYATPEMHICNDPDLSCMTHMFADQKRKPVPGSLTYQKESNTLAVCCKVCPSLTFNLFSTANDLNPSLSTPPPLPHQNISL